MMDQALEKLTTYGVLGVLSALLLGTVGWLARELFALHRQRYADALEAQRKADEREERHRQREKESTDATRDLTLALREHTAAVGAMKTALDSNTMIVSSALKRSSSGDRFRAVRKPEED